MSVKTCLVLSFFILKITLSITKNLPTPTQLPPTKIVTGLDPQITKGSLSDLTKDGGV